MFGLRCVARAFDRGFDVLSPGVARTGAVYSDESRSGHTSVLSTEIPPRRDRGTSPRLTRREIDVLAALAERLTNAEIAARLFVSERTVESHVAALLRKLEATNRRELADIAQREQSLDRQSRLPAVLELLVEPAGFVGRAGERRRLGELWRRCVTGPLRIAVLAGEAGIGKSRLAAEFAAEVDRSGGRVLLGMCFEDAEAPFQPFVEAIADDLSTLSEVSVRRRAASDTAALARIIPGLARRTGVVATATNLDPVSGQATIAAAVGRYLRRAAEEAPLLLVIEDLHFATATTRATVRHLARSPIHAPILMLITTRDTAPDVDDELRMLLGDLARMPAVDSINLGGLPAADVADLLARLGSTADATTVTNDTGGNPLLVVEVAHSRGGTTASLHAMLARRYALLTDADLTVVDVASVVGTEFDADVVARSVGCELEAALASLERIAAAGLVHAVPGRPGQFAFTHALFRRARYDSIPPHTRLVIHRDVAATLAARLPADEAVLPELARHASIAAPLGNAPKAVDYAMLAAARAERSLGLGEAATHYRRALQVAAMIEEPQPDLVLTLTIKLGEVLNGIGDPQSRELLLRAAAMARDDRRSGSARQGCAGNDALRRRAGPRRRPRVRRHRRRGAPGARSRTQRAPRTGARRLVGGRDVHRSGPGAGAPARSAGHRRAARRPGDTRSRPALLPPRRQDPRQRRRRASDSQPVDHPRQANRPHTVRPPRSRPAGVDVPRGGRPGFG